MKAEEKALNILIVFERVKFSQNVEYNKKLAKQCAAICVQEIIDVIGNVPEGYQPFDYLTKQIVELHKFYQSVLTSIQKQ